MHTHSLDLKRPIPIPLVKEKITHDVVKGGKADLLRGTTTMGFCSRRERAGSTLTTPRISGDLLPNNKVRASGWK